MRQVFDVSGMSCAACASRVQTCVEALPGVVSASVNVLRGTLEVISDDTTYAATDLQDKVIATLNKAGYPAAVHTSGQLASETSSAATTDTQDTLCSQTADTTTSKDDAELSHLLWVFIVSLVATLLLEVLVMGPGSNFVSIVSSYVTQSTARFLYVLAQVACLCPVLIANKHVFKKGWLSLRYKAPTMDTLVGLGVCSSILYGILTACAILGWLPSSGLISAHSHTAHGLGFDSAAMILCFISFGKYLEGRAKHKATSELRLLAELSAPYAIRIVHGQEQRCALNEVQVGDTLIVRTGARVPVDGSVIKGFASIDESALTGEAIPRDVSESDEIIGGTLVSAGCIQMRATRVGSDTMLAEVSRLVDQATASKPAIQVLADKVSAVFVPCVLGIAFLTFFVWLMLGDGVSTALLRGVSVLVVSCPCALGLATPAAVTAGAGKGARLGILMKSAQSLQQAANVNLVCFDKTGTLTQGRPKLCAVACGKDTTEAELIRLAAGVERFSEHPFAHAIVDYAQEHKLTPLPAQDFEQLAGGVLAQVHNERVAIGNRRLMRACGISMKELQQWDACIDDASAAMLYILRGAHICGVCAFKDTVREQSFQAICALQSRGIDVEMLTGDAKLPASYVATELGLASFTSDLLPLGKASVITQRQDEGITVCMVGDGVNDAPALAAADIGIALGAGTDIASAAADVVLVSSNPETVVHFFDLSKATMRIIKQNLFWALIYNLACIPAAAGALLWAGIVLNPMAAAAAMSLSSVCVVTNALRLQLWHPRKLGTIRSHS